MEKLRTIFINPNPRSHSLIQPVVSLFYSILKDNDIDMEFFDTTLYDVSDHYADTEKFIESNLLVKRYNHSAFNKTKNVKKTMKDLLNDLRAKVISYKPHVILASAVESTFLFTIDILKSIRDLKIPHLLGGVFATFSPEKSISFNEIDYVCVGEAEGIIAQLVKGIAEGRDVSYLPGVWIKNSKGEIKEPKIKIAGIFDLENIPRFDASIYDESRFYRAMAGKVYRMFPVETHRGCTNKCTFCNSPLQNIFYREELGKHYFRKRSIIKVMEDIRYFVKDMGAEYLFFWADNFLTYTKREIDEFYEMYSEYKIPFYIQSYPTNLDDYKIKKLYKVGLKRVGLGIEHGNEKFRKEIVKRIYSNKLAIERIKILQKYDGLEYSCNNIIGFPTETPELHMDTVILNKKLKPHSASCSIFTPFRGTPLRDLCVKLGYLKNPDIIAPTNSEESILEMPQFTSDQILGKSRTFNIYLKFPERRWNEIKQAELITPEGNKIWLELREEYLTKY